MDFTHCYRINQPAVIAEVIDEEVIVVNLDSGAYYSLRDSACVIWELLVQQMPPATVVQVLATRYTGPSAAIQAGVATLLEALLDERLLAPATCQSDAAPQMSGSDNPGELLPLPSPALEKFTDMADLLLLDPIHEVDETGWPHAAPAQGARMRA